VISEGSHDTDDWSNDAENSALITGVNYFLKYITIENIYFTIIFHIFTVFCDQLTASPFSSLSSISFPAESQTLHILSECETAPT